MKAVDPDGVELRKKQAPRRRKYFLRGPSWGWYIGRYDKLKPYGALYPNISVH